MSDETRCGHCNPEGHEHGANWRLCLCCADYVREKLEADLSRITGERDGLVGEVERLRGCLQLIVDTGTKDVERIKKYAASSIARLPLTQEGTPAVDRDAVLEEALRVCREVVIANSMANVEHGYEMVEECEQAIRALKSQPATPPPERAAEPSAYDLHRPKINGGLGCEICDGYCEQGEDDDEPQQPTTHTEGGGR